MQATAIIHQAGADRGNSRHARTTPTGNIIADRDKHALLDGAQSLIPVVDRSTFVGRTVAIKSTLHNLATAVVLVDGATEITRPVVLEVGLLDRGSAAIGGVDRTTAVPTFIAYESTLSENRACLDAEDCATLFGSVLRELALFEESIATFSDEDRPTVVGDIPLSEQAFLDCW